MKKNEDIRTYTLSELERFQKQYVVAAHNELVREEKRLGKKVFETFGEWQKKHPNHPIAKKDYPKDEFV